MVLAEKLLFKIKLVNVDYQEKLTELMDGLVLSRLLLEPTFFQSSLHQKESFKLADAYSSLQSVNEKKTGWCVVGNEEEQCQIQFNQTTIQISAHFQWGRFLKNQLVIRDYIQVKMSKHGVFAYLRAYEEYLYNNTSGISERSIVESPEETEKLPKFLGQSGKIEVDCNLFPGYDLLFEALCFTSCWEMYYSYHYYRFIPKEIFLEVQQVERVTEYENHVIGIQIYREPFRWKSKTNQKFQQYYRDQLGFDHLAWDNGVGLLREPFVEYAYTDDMLQSVQYQNQLMQPVEKKKATFFVTRTYNFSTHEYSERRAKGMLNRQAFFPWVDDTHSQLICYKVIDPTFTLDNGVKAYSYYIKEYLDIEAPDVTYQSYLTTLRIYVPSLHLKEFPLSEIRQQLPNVTFKRLRKRRGRISFDVTQGRKRLRVILLSQNELDMQALQKI